MALTIRTPSPSPTSPVLGQFGGVNRPPLPINDPSSDAGIRQILKVISPNVSIEDDAVKQIQSFLAPIENDLNTLVTYNEVINYIMSRFPSKFTRVLIVRYEEYANKSSIVEYLIEEMLKYTGNTRNTRDEKLTQRDIIEVVGTDDLLDIFMDTMPLFVHIKPEVKRGMKKYIVAKADIRLPGRQLSGDYVKGLYHLMIAIVNHYTTRPWDEIRQTAQKIAVRSGRGAEGAETTTENLLLYLQDQVIRTILAYSMVLQPVGEMNYTTLMAAAMTNPYLEDIPMIQIVHEESHIAELIGVVLWGQKTKE